MSVSMQEGVFDRHADKPYGALIMRIPRCNYQRASLHQKYSPFPFRQAIIVADLASITLTMRVVLLSQWHL